MKVRIIFIAIMHVKSWIVVHISIIPQLTVATINARQTMNAQADIIHVAHLKKATIKNALQQLLPGHVTHNNNTDDY